MVAEGTAQQILKLVTEADPKGFEAIKTSLTELGTQVEQLSTKLAGLSKGGAPDTAGLTALKTSLTEAGTAADTAATDLAKPLKALSGTADTSGLTSIDEAIKTAVGDAGDADGSLSKILHAMAGTADTSGLTSMTTALDTAKTAASEADDQLAKPLHALAGTADTSGLTSMTTALDTAKTAVSEADDQLAKPLHALAGEADTSGLTSMTSALDTAKSNVSDADEQLAKPLHVLAGEADTSGLKTIQSDLGHVGESAQTADDNLGKIRTTEDGIESTNVQKLKTDLDEAGSSADTADSKLGEIAKKITEFGSQFAQGLGFQGLPQTLAGFSKESVDFNESLQKTQALAGASGDEMKGYKEGIDKLTDTVPVSAKQFADALFLVKSAGYSGQDALNILKTSGEAAAAGLGSTATIANTVTSSLTAYGKGSADAASITDTLTEAVTQGKTSADQFAPALAKVLPVAAATGVSFQEVSANMATLTRIMPNADEAATALRSTLTAFVKPGKDAQSAAADLGTSFDELRQELKEKGLLATLQDLMDRTGGNVDQLAKLFPNVRALTDVLGTSGPQTEKYKEILAAMGDSAGATSKAFGVMSDSMTFQTGLLHNKLQSEFDAIANQVFPLLISGLHAVNELLPPLFDAVGKAFDPLKAALSFIGDHKEILAGLAIGLGVATVALYAQAAAAVVATAATTAFDAALAVATAPFTLITLAVAALVIGIIELVKHWDDITKAVPQLGVAWDAISAGAKAAASAIADAFGAVVSAVGDVISGIKEHWDTIVDVFKGPFEIIKGALQGAFDVIKDIITTQVKVLGDVFSLFGDIASGNWKKAWDDIKQIVSDVFDGIKKIIGDQIKEAGAVLGGVGDTLKTLWTAAWNVLKDALTPIWDGIKTAMTTVWTGFKTFLTPLWDVLKTLWTTAWDAVKNVLGTVWDGIKTATSTAWDTFKGYLTTLWAGLSTATATAWDAVTGIGGKIVDGMKGAITALGDATSGVLGDLASALSAVWTALTSAVGDAWDATSGIASKILDGIKGAITALGDATSGVLGDLASALSAVWTALTSTVADAWDATSGIASKILDGIKAGIMALGDATSGVLGDLASALSRVWTGLTTAVADAWNATTGIGSKILDGITGAITSLGDKASGIFGTLFTNITTVFGDIKQWFLDHAADLTTAISQPFKDFGTGIGDILKGGLNNAIDVFNTFLGGISSFFGAVANAVNWVTNKLGLGNVLTAPDMSALVPHLATGTQAFTGGLAMVGELGPELVHLPPGTAVLPAHETARVAPEVLDSQGQRRRVIGPPRMGIDIPGFLFGIDPGAVLDAIKHAWDKIKDFAKEWLAKGAEALTSTAFGMFHVGDIPGGGLMGDLGKGIAGEVKHGVVEGIKELLGLAQKAQPQELAAGVASIGDLRIAADVVRWANQFAAQLGVDPRKLATMLLASTVYETGATDIGEIDPSRNPGGVAGVGPFQITPGSKATDLGLNPHSAYDSLTYFLRSGDMTTGISAYKAGLSRGLSEALAAHEWEIYAGRPEAGGDADRMAKGDWQRAFNAALAFVGGGTAGGSAAGAGGWVKPLLGAYTITQGFGPADPSVAGMEPGGFHEGIDLASVMGDTVVAAHSGTVSAAGSGVAGGLGVAVVINHGNGIVSEYGHLLDVTASGGEPVIASQPVGHEDSTGASTGTHLHFQINVNGSPVDPRQFVPLAAGGLVTSPTYAMVGESGPELVLPLSNRLGLGRGADAVLPLTRLGTAGVGGAAAGGTATAEHVTNAVSQIFIDSTLFAELTYRGTDRNIRMRGTFP